MPNCFQLVRDGSAVPLVQVDEEMCRHFGEPCDSDRYFRAWYATIGYDLAMGRTFEEIRAIYSAPEWTEAELGPVVDWLAANFSPRSWYEHKGANTGSSCGPVDK